MGHRNLLATSFAPEISSTFIWLARQYISFAVTSTRPCFSSLVREKYLKILNGSSNCSKRVISRAQPRPQGHLWSCSRWTAISPSDPRGHRKVLPFDWLTGEQKIFVNYYDYAALIRNQLQRTLNGLKNNKGGRASFKEHLQRLSDRKQQNKERVVLWMPASSSKQNQTKKDRKC